MDRTDHFLLPPDTDFKRISGKVWQKMDIYVLSERRIRHFDELAKQGDLAIAIHEACPT